MDEKLELYHYGVKGQKWGIRRTPEQLGHPKKLKKVRGLGRGTIAETGQQVYYYKDTDGIFKVNTDPNILKKARKQKKIAEQKKKRLEKEREEILRSPSKLYKNRDKFTKEEIDAAMKRFKWEKELRELSKSELSAGKEYVNTILDYADTGMRAYNTAAKLYNTFGKKDGNDKMKQIPGVGEGKKKK